ncbi:hypothetical protein JXA48_01525 [Candidatus Woesearchaeota archaeon]|nr:hypothetical protein [Candidatus Woesearchaeota archaeon]
MSLLVFMTTIGAYANTQAKITNMKPYLTECKLTLAADSFTQGSKWLSSKIEDACYTVKLDTMNDLRRPSDILRYASNRMAQSWDITWEGKKDLWDPNEGAFFQVGGYDCIIFFELDYTHPKYEGEVNVTDFFNYMIETDMKDREITYAEYIQGKAGNGAWLIHDDIKPGNVYAVSIMNPHEAEVNVFKDIKRATSFGTGSLVSLMYDKPAEEIIKAISPELNTIIIFSEINWAKQQNCIYRGVEV